MIPFLKNKSPNNTGVITTLRTDNGMEEQTPADSEGLEACMEDFCKAHEKKDYKAMASAIKAAFEILDSAPHEEGPHTNE